MIWAKQNLICNGYDVHFIYRFPIFLLHCSAPTHNYIPYMYL